MLWRARAREGQSGGQANGQGRPEWKDRVRLPSCQSQKKICSRQGGWVLGRGQHLQSHQRLGGVVGGARCIKGDAAAEYLLVVTPADQNLATGRPVDGVDTTCSGVRREIECVCVPPGAAWVGGAVGGSAAAGTAPHRQGLLHALSQSNRPPTLTIVPL